MDSTTLVIVLLSVGSVLMDLNLKEFCGKKYFDTFMASYSTGRTELQVTRKVNSNDRAYHLWDILIEEQNEKYNSNVISYEVKEDPIHKSPLIQPTVCAITYNSTIDSKTFGWALKDFHIENGINGPEVNYTECDLRIKKIYEETIDEWNCEPKESSLKMPNSWLSGLLCKVSDKTIYAIVEKNNSMNASNRTQVVYELRIERSEKNERLSDAVFIVWNTIEFSLESMNKSIIEFLGINCDNIDSEHQFLVSTHTLLVIFLVLFVLGICLSFINSILIIRRRKQMKRYDTEIHSQSSITTSSTNEKSS